MVISKLDFKKFSIEIWLLKDIRGKLLEEIINTSIGKYFSNFRVARYRREHIKNKHINLKKNIGLEILCLNPRLSEFENLFAKKDIINQKNLHNAIRKIIDLLNKILFKILKGDFYYFNVNVLVNIEQTFAYEKF